MNTSQQKFGSDLVQEATAQYKEALCKQMTNRMSREGEKKARGVVVEEIVDPPHSWAEEP